MTFEQLALTPLVVAFVFFLVKIVILWRGYYPATKYKPIPSEIVYLNLKPRGRMLTCNLELFYRYTIDGKDYGSTELSIYPMPLYRSHSRLFIKKIMAGGDSGIKAYVNPSNHHESYIQPLNWSIFIPPSICLILVTICLFLLLTP